MFLQQLTKPWRQLLCEHLLDGKPYPLLVTQGASICVFVRSMVKLLQAVFTFLWAYSCSAKLRHEFGSKYFFCRCGTVNIFLMQHAMAKQ